MQRRSRKNFAFDMCLKGENMSSFLKYAVEPTFAQLVYCKKLVVAIQVCHLHENDYTFIITKKICFWQFFTTGHLFVFHSITYLHDKFVTETRK